MQDTLVQILFVCAIASIALRLSIPLPPTPLQYFVWEAMQDTLVQILFVCAIASIALRLSIPLPPTPLQYFVWEAMQDTLVQILFVCAIASIAVSIPAEGSLSAPFPYFVWEAMQDTLVQILFVCAIASIAVSIPAEGSLEGLYDGLGIFIALFLIITVAGRHRNILVGTAAAHPLAQWCPCEPLGSLAGLYDGLGIFIALFLIITVAAISNYRQAVQFQKLNREKQKIQIEVTRSGRRCKVWIDDLVVGDIIHLSTGDHVPTDGVVMEGHSLAVNESSITGESENMHKDEASPFILAGCTIMDGFGEMMVTAVGMRTEWGKVLATITEDSDEPTPLQVRLTRVAELLGIMGITVGVLIFLILSIRYLVTDADFSNFTANDVSVLLSYFTIAVCPHPSHPSHHCGMLPLPQSLDHSLSYCHPSAVCSHCNAATWHIRYLSSCPPLSVPLSFIHLSHQITVLVIAVPEGLPLAVTLTLAFSVTKMMEDNSLVRHLQSCETMGCATTICSDKTGTLTLNEMTVVQAWVAGDFHKPHTVRTGVSTPVAQLLYQAIAVNTSGSVDEPPGMPPVISGSPTEKAILAWGVSFGMRFHETKGQCEVVAVQPFSSTRKRMGVLIRTAESPTTADSLTAAFPATTASTSSTGTAGSTTPGSLRVHWKGAAEVVLQHCGHYVNSLGSIVPLTEPKRMELERALRDMGKEALRTLGFAFRDFDKRTGVEGMPKREDGSSAGIVVRMVTGDSVETATAIATECGILTAGGTVMDGATFRAIHENDLPATVDRLQVLARASPTDKLQLVRALKEMGHVVAVTGDGTNDAPALHEADIGLAMGQCGTEVAKESADIIILDDNFASIVRTVVWGRSVFANIQRFLQFQITVNCVALTLNFISAVVTGDAPLTAVQMLWVDLIQDTLGALALATEPPSDKLLEQPPVGRSQELVSAAMWRNIIGQTVYQLSLLCVLWFKGMELLQLPGPPGVPRVIAKGGEEISEGEKQLVTIIFSSFVFMQLPGPPGVLRVIAKGGEEISEGEKQLVTIIFSSFVFMQMGGLEKQLVTIIFSSFVFMQVGAAWGGVVVVGKMQLVTIILSSFVFMQVWLSEPPPKLSHLSALPFHLHPPFHRRQPDIQPAELSQAGGVERIFNQLNSRKLEEWNVFEGLLTNRLFILIVSIELTVQVSTGLCS
ncbi:unnamed protein product [Closterium sp. Naga37s-1]|nr:unnamed protein product [Closterium sp. Naga37s-1]